MSAELSSPLDQIVPCPSPQQFPFLSEQHVLGLLYSPSWLCDAPSEENRGRTAASQLPLQVIRICVSDDEIPRPSSADTGHGGEVLTLPQFGRWANSIPRRNKRINWREGFASAVLEIGKEERQKPKVVREMIEAPVAPPPHSMVPGPEPSGKMIHIRSMNDELIIDCACRLEPKPSTPRPVGNYPPLPPMEVDCHSGRNRSIFHSISSNSATSLPTPLLQRAQMEVKP